MTWLLLTLLAAWITYEILHRGSITRWGLREVVRLFVLGELAALRLVRTVIRPKYVLLGECHRRGTCCTMIVGNPPRLIKKQAMLLAAFAAYHRIVHNFHVRGRGADGELVFRCGHLQTDGRCGIYRYRPFICRNYPLIPFFEPPRPLPGCGYRVAARAVAQGAQRLSLPIVNATVAVHHPTRLGGIARDELPDDYERVAIE